MIGLLKHIEIGDIFHVDRKKVGKIKNEENNKLKKNGTKIPETPHYESENDMSPYTLEKIIDFMLKGYESAYVAKKTGLTSDQIRKIVKKEMQKRNLSQKDLDNIRERKRENDLEEIATLIEKGYTYTEIAGIKDEYNRNSISKIAEQLVKLGRLTKSQIGTAQIQRSNRIKKIDEFVFQSLEDGLTISEMIELAQKQGIELSENIISDSRKRIIESNPRCRKKFQKANYKRQLVKQQEEYRRIENTIWKYLKEGYSTTQIMEKMNISHNFYYQRRKALMARKQITLDDIKRMRKIGQEKQKRNDEKESLAQKQKEERLSRLKRLYSYIRDQSENETIGIKEKKRYIEVSKELVENGIDISDFDYEFIKDYILNYEQLFTTDNLRFIVKYNYIRVSNLLGLKTFLNTCLAQYENTKYADKIRKFLKHVQDYIELKKTHSVTIDDINLLEDIR